MASVKDKRPAARGPGAKLPNKQNLDQRALIERGGEGFEKFIQQTRQDNERATELHARLRGIGLEGCGGQVNSDTTIGFFAAMFRS